MLNASPNTESRVCFYLVHVRHIQEGCPQSCNWDLPIAEAPQHPEEANIVVAIACYLITEIYPQALYHQLVPEAELMPSQMVSLFSALH